MNEFKNYHPIVSFIYFISVIGFSCVFMHPVCLLISFIGSFTYSIILNGKQAFRFNLLYMLPVILTTALINPAFNHEGVTILCILPGGNPLTLESIIYGLCAALMLCNVICWFSCYNKIFTSDKIIYLFGKILPSLSLLISMTLRFVPKFLRQFKLVASAQKGIGRDFSDGNILKRAKYGLSILSVMITWALESSVETADSMRARGYGLQGRTSFSLFRFCKKDFLNLLFIIILCIFILYCKLSGVLYFSYFPMIKTTSFSLKSISANSAYFLLCMLPAIIQIREVIKWKYLKSKI